MVRRSWNAAEPPETTLVALQSEKARQSPYPDTHPLDGAHILQRPGHDMLPGVGDSRPILSCVPLVGRRKPWRYCPALASLRRATRYRHSELETTIHGEATHHKASRRVPGHLTPQALGAHKPSADCKCSHRSMRAVRPKGSQKLDLSEQDAAVHSP